MPGHTVMPLCALPLSQAFAMDWKQSFELPLTFRRSKPPRPQPQTPPHSPCRAPPRAHARSGQASPKRPAARDAAGLAAVSRGREATGHHRPSCDHRCVCQVTAVLVNPSGSSQLSPPRWSTDAGEHLLLEPPVRVARPFRAISDQAWQPYACAPVP
jgi:hypothetical protein